MPSQFYRRIRHTIEKENSVGLVHEELLKLNLGMECKNKNNLFLVA